MVVHAPQCFRIRLLPRVFRAVHRDAGWAVIHAASGRGHHCPPTIQKHPAGQSSPGGGQSQSRPPWLTVKITPGQFQAHHLIGKQIIAQRLRAALKVSALLKSTAGCGSGRPQIHELYQKSRTATPPSGQIPRSEATNGSRLTASYSPSAASAGLPSGAEADDASMITKT